MSAPVSAGAPRARPGALIRRRFTAMLSAMLTAARPGMNPSRHNGIRSAIDRFNEFSDHDARPAAAHPFGPTAGPARAAAARPLCGVPLPDGRRVDHRLRGVHARPARQRRDMERGRRAHQGFPDGRNHRQPFLAFLSSRCDRGRPPGARARSRRRVRSLPGRKLARTQGRFAILGQRDDHGRTRRVAPVARLHQDHARHDRAQARGGTRSGHAAAGRLHRNARARAAQPARAAAAYDRHPARPAGVRTGPGAHAMQGHRGSPDRTARPARRRSARHRTHQVRQGGTQESAGERARYRVPQRAGHSAEGRRARAADHRAAAARARDRSRRRCPARPGAVQPARQCVEVFAERRAHRAPRAHRAERGCDRDRRLRDRHRARRAGIDLRPVRAGACRGAPRARRARAWARDQQEIRRPAWWRHHGRQRRDRRGVDVYGPAADRGIESCGRARAKGAGAIFHACAAHPDRRRQPRIGRHARHPDADQGPHVPCRVPRARCAAARPRIRAASDADRPQHAGRQRVRAAPRVALDRRRPRFVLCRAVRTCAFVGPTGHHGRRLPRSFREADSDRGAGQPARARGGRCAAPRSAVTMGTATAERRAEAARGAKIRRLSIHTSKRFDGVRAGFHPHPPLAGHSVRHRDRVLAGNRTRPAPRTVAPAGSRRVHAGRAAGARRTHAGRRT
ncbi:putative RecJ [Burkholderia ambifaria]